MFDKDSWIRVCGKIFRVVGIGISSLVKNYNNFVVVMLSVKTEKSDFN